jgi:hypothetical protein
VNSKKNSRANFAGEKKVYSHPSAKGVKKIQRKLRNQKLSGGGGNKKLWIPCDFQ